MKKSLTVFTPTYNRAYCLHQVYDSLVNQTCPDFEWMIIDDGSTDGTKDLVNKWIKENRLVIQYIYQENQGMHGAYNTAYHNASTELIVCIDSDDFMPDNAVELILDKWNKDGSGKYSGIVGLDALKNGEIIGSKFPDNLVSSSLEDIYYKYHIPGDKKLVFRTEVVKKYPPYPSFPGENFVPHGSLFIQIDKDYELLCLNEVLVIVEYLDDGSSRNIFKQFRRHPQGFRYGRMIKIKHSKYIQVKFRNLIHLVATHIQLKKWNIFRDNPYPFLTLLAIPFGILLYFYILFKSRK